MIVKLSGIVFVVLSMISILSAGCAPPAPGHHYETAEDGSSVLVADDSSAPGLPAIAQDLKRLSWEIGPEVYYYRYKEPTLMEVDGIFYGAALGFTLRNWLPRSPEQTYEAMDIAFYKYYILA